MVNSQVSFLVYLPMSKTPFHFATLVEFASHRWPCQIFGKLWVVGMGMTGNGNVRNVELGS